MNVYTQSTKNGGTVFTSHKGIPEATVISLLQEIGHTDITVVSEETYNAAGDAQL